MRIFNFFKKSINNVREVQPVKPEHIIYKNTKEQTSRRSISDAEFQTDQFLHEILAFTLWKYNENNGEYSAVYKCLTEMDGISLTEGQVNDIIEMFKRWQNLEYKKTRFKDLFDGAQKLVNDGYNEEALDLVYSAYKNDSSDIELVQLISQLADMYKPVEQVLEIFDALILVNSDDAYNIKYRKALYLKIKRFFTESIELFEKLNIEFEFAWNYYQIAIIHNLLDNKSICLDNLKKAFQLNPELKQDAIKFPELQNLKDDSIFIILVNAN